MSIQAYQRASAQAENPRETEYRLFATITSGLIKAQEQGRAHLGVFAEALDKNRRLWTILANDCASEGNELPAPLRAQIISLSMWVSRQTSAVIQGSEEIEPLIDVNRTIMQGLAPQLSAQPATAAAG
jgi:flagellar biosynthesis activator protein FlaF